MIQKKMGYVIEKYFTEIDVVEMKTQYDELISMLETSGKVNTEEKEKSIKRLEKDRDDFTSGWHGQLFRKQYKKAKYEMLRFKDYDRRSNQRYQYRVVKALAEFKQDTELQFTGDYEIIPW